MRCAIVLGLAGAFLLTAARAGDDKEKKNGKEPLKVEGKLNEDDPTDKVMEKLTGNKCPFKAREHKMKEGEIWIIDLSSKDFDAVLRVEDAKGKQLAFNDDDPGRKTLDSRLVFKAPKDDAYKIIATCL